MNTPASQRKIRMGMVGGGRGAFIGAIHRIAAAMDGRIELVCGAFSSDPQRSRDSGADLYLPTSPNSNSYTSPPRHQTDWAKTAETTQP